jgi:hypothetical protein
MLDNSMKGFAFEAFPALEDITAMQKILRLFSNDLNHVMRMVLLE